MNRRTKEQVVAELHEKLKGARWAVLANYRGMNVEKITALRNVLRKSDTELRVVKNTLLRIASAGTDLMVLEDYFKGPLAIALNAKNVVEQTKVLVEFAKRNAELEINVGMLDGKFLSKEQIGALAELPGRDVLLGRLLSVLVEPPAAIVNVLSAVPRSLVQVLNAYRLQQEETKK